MEYVGPELMVLEMVKQHLTESPLLTNEGYQPLGGLHIKAKKMPINPDMVEINMLGKLHYIDDRVIALVNVNIYNDLEKRTDELTKVIMKVMNGVNINLIKFKTDRAWYSGQSKRKYQNVLFKGEINKTDFDILCDSYL